LREDVILPRSTCSLTGGLLSLAWALGCAGITAGCDGSDGPANGGSNVQNAADGAVVHQIHEAGSGLGGGGPGSCNLIGACQLVTLDEFKSEFSVPYGAVSEQPVSASGSGADGYQSTACTALDTSVTPPREAFVSIECRLDGPIDAAMVKAAETAERQNPVDVAGLGDASFWVVGDLNPEAGIAITPSLTIVSGAIEIIVAAWDPSGPGPDMEPMAIDLGRKVLGRVLSGETADASP
jgi:hypothetical protein